MKSQLYSVVLCLLLLSACQSNTKENVKTSTSEIEVTKHVKAYKNISLSNALLKNGLKINNSEIKDSPAGGSNNVLTLQIVFEADFTGILFVTISDDNEKVLGRAKLEVEGQKERVDNFDFTFGETIEILESSKILVE